MKTRERFRFLRPLLKFKCPHCGFENATTGVVIRGFFTHRELYQCDGEEGGCDRDFVINVRVEQPIVSVQKIEGDA